MGWRLSACVATILLGLPGVIARAQNGDDANSRPRLAIDRLGARDGTLVVGSEAFAPRDPIPTAYTAEGGNIAPPIFWNAGPRATRSYVVIAEDASTSGGPHRLLWLVYDIPSEQTALGVGARLRVSRQRNGPVIARGKNSLGTVGYAGPRPTLAEGTHTYHFQVFALDTVLPSGKDLPAGDSKEEKTCRSPSPSLPARSAFRQR
jgi:Raf kinase inhibitor-like YbhB/YbcL family protein